MYLKLLRLLHSIRVARSVVTFGIPCFFDVVEILYQIQTADIASQKNLQQAIPSEFAHLRRAYRSFASILPLDQRDFATVHKAFWRYMHWRTQCLFTD